MRGITGEIERWKKWETEKMEDGDASEMVNIMRWGEKCRRGVRAERE